MVGGQTGADLDRVNELAKVRGRTRQQISLLLLAFRRLKSHRGFLDHACLQVLPTDRVELDPGDCLFFHSNLLHTSAPNERYGIERVGFLCGGLTSLMTTISRLAFSQPQSALGIPLRLQPPEQQPLQGAPPLPGTSILRRNEPLHFLWLLPKVFPFVL